MIPVVFGLGLPKTGTVTLVQCLNKLGYKKVFHHTMHDYRIQRKEPSAIITYGTVNTLKAYHFLAKRFGNKIVITVRDYDSWIVSAMQHCKKGSFEEESFSLDENDPVKIYHLEQRFRRFGKVFPSKEDLSAAYWEHQEWLETIKDDPNVLLYNICRGEQWEPLCSFLEKDVPDAPFPHAHKTKKN